MNETDRSVIWAEGAEGKACFSAGQKAYIARLLIECGKRLMAEAQRTPEPRPTPQNEAEAGNT